MLFLNPNEMRTWRVRLRPSPQSTVKYVVRHAHVTLYSACPSYRPPSRYPEIKIKPVLELDIRPGQVNYRFWCLGGIFVNKLLDLGIFKVHFAVNSNILEFQLFGFEFFE